MFQTRMTIIIIFSLLPLQLWAACTGSTPNWSCTADYASMDNLINHNTPAGFTAGDTITVSGNATWDTSLPITKAIYLIGSGNPIITRGAFVSPLITIQPTSGDPVIRISRFRFEQVTNVGSDRVAINVIGKSDGSGSGLTKIRIDHNYFNKGKNAVTLNYWLEILVDNNTFNNCDIGVRINGDGNYSWQRAITPGTNHANFIEDNTFIADEANRDRNLNQQIYQQGGARSVTRYNTIDVSAVTSAGAASLYDSHGNQGGCDTPFGIFRGQPLLEVYNNTFKAYSGNAIAYEMVGIHGGSSLIHDNNFYTTTGSNPYTIRLWEEETWSSGNFVGPCTAYPSGDQINNSFFWNNNRYYQGATSPTLLTDASKHSNNVAGSITKDIDYFMHEPQATGGKNILTSVATYGYITGQKYGTPMSFAAGQQAYYPYTPYTYPHPLSKLAPPLKLRIIP